MKRIIKDQQIVTDNWQHLADDETLCTGDITLSLDRWLKHKDILELLPTRNRRIGVRLEGDDDPALLLPELSRLPLIVLHFPIFTDGRCYSLARLLRGRYHYANELRATGDILRDQLILMARCGINAFELDSSQDLDSALQAFGEITVQYQPDGLNTASRYGDYHKDTPLSVATA